VGPQIPVNRPSPQPLQVPERQRTPAPSIGVTSIPIESSSSTTRRQLSSERPTPPTTQIIQPSHQVTQEQQSRGRDPRETAQTGRPGAAQAALRGSSVPRFSTAMPTQYPTPTNPPPQRRVGVDQRMVAAAEKAQERARRKLATPTYPGGYEGSGQAHTKILPSPRYSPFGLPVKQREYRSRQ
jgi:hypothetical protein